MAVERAESILQTYILTYNLIVSMLYQYINCANGNKLLKDKQTFVFKTMDGTRRLLM